MIDDYRLKQSRDQARAIDDRGQTKVTRVGDRDAQYGHETVIEPDGSTRRLGVKTYNAKLESGTPVLATDRPDGTTALQSLKADPSSKVAPKIFGIPEQKPRISAWALGLQNLETTSKLFLLDLKFGTSYLVLEWPSTVPGCPSSSPPPNPADYPNWQRAWEWTETGFGKFGNYSENSSSDGGVPAGISIVVISMYSLPSQATTDQSSGPWWGVGWFTASGNFIATSLFESDALGESGDAYIASQPVLTNMRIVSESGGPEDPGGGGGAEPRSNDAIYSLSLDILNRPIVRVEHTPPCTAGQPYGVRGYFRLQSTIIAEYPIGTAIGDWRNQLPDFRCRQDLSSNLFASFDRSRSIYYVADSAKDTYTRPESIQSGMPIAILISKIFAPLVGACPISSENNQMIYANYSAGPQLELVAIVAYEA